MRIIASLIATAIIITAAFASGCAEPSDSPYELSRRWEAVLTADARAAAQEFADSVNERLGAYRGTIYVDIQEYGRVTFFEALPGAVNEGTASHGTALIMTVNGRPVTPTPEGTIRSEEWFDRFALAQELSAWCEVSSLRLTQDEGGTPVLFEATAEFTLTGTWRSAIAEQTKPLPQPPEGYRYWTDWLCGRGGGGPASYIISVPHSLPGKPFRAGADELADEAVALLRQIEPTPVNIWATCALRYVSSDARWRVVRKQPASDAILDRDELSWWLGIKKADRRKVLAPR